MHRLSPKEFREIFGGLCARDRASLLRRAPVLLASEDPVDAELALQAAAEIARAAAAGSPIDDAQAKALALRRCYQRTLRIVEGMKWQAAHGR